MLYKKAFTLIELVVVVGIIILGTGMAVAAYSSYTQDKRLKEQADKIEDTIALAHQKAISAEGGSCANFAGYRIFFNANSYTLRKCCTNGCTNTPVQDTDVNIYSFQYGAFLKTFPGSMRFQPLTGDLVTGATTITVKAGTQCINLAVSQVGTIDQSLKYTSGC